MDDQTGDFFAPAEADSPFGATPIAPIDSGYDDIGDVDLTGETPAAENPPAVMVMPAPEEYMMGPPPTEDDPIILGSPMDAPVGFGEDATPAEKTPMQKFADEWQVILRERKDHENSSKAEVVMESQKEMELFHERRDKTRETRMAKNRSDEQSKLESLEADLENDNSWQRVVKMVELQADTVEASEDTKRMRDVLISLKNDKDKALALSE
eukprot:CAMPEP_0171312632 /NCGR_PEP_ID=MMETSP0816-20121228/26877_1 /TAXON_ID=420281 /ORGANISM="Proboscia inermis, Strain CCAP1064/1" /LENGTH=210 /DNA_ID=CAMNT_0011798273 /DNA_START=24 /DNA_END=656 /DNA_ORIENTATION=+